MLKMLLDPMGGIVMTNDGNCILREVDVSHPTAKSMIELSRAQDEEVGDGTTSVIVLSAQILASAEPFLKNKYHPTVICQAYSNALAFALKKCDELAYTIDVQNDKEWMSKLVLSTIGTNFSSSWNDQLVDMAIQAVTTVVSKTPGGSPIVDLKRYAKVEKIPGGQLDDACVLKGVMIQKDTTHSKMRRRIENPRILLVDSPLEYKKGESQTNMEITESEDWNTMLRLEEEYVEKMCNDIIAAKPDIVLTEKGVSDLAQHYLQKAGITAFRRLRKTDNNRVAKAVGATIVSRTDEIQESDIGTKCGLFEMRKLGNDWFCYLEDCEDPKACTIVLRGGSKDVLNEIERSLQDAMQVVRNVVYDPKLLPGGGAIEMALAVAIRKEGQKLHGIQQAPFMAVGDAMEVIPRTLAQNCGVSVIRTITSLRAKHASTNDGEKCCVGVNGTTGELVDMNELGIWEPYAVKVQIIKSAIENACMILRIDDIVSGSKKKGY
jgi:T-complex protein 1 subunit gamma